MTLIDEKVEHIIFGVGVITEEKDDIIYVEFQEEIGSKAFIYPDAFEKFLKAVNKDTENSILEDINGKREKLEDERIERELASAELETKKVKSLPAKKKKKA